MMSDGKRKFAQPRFVELAPAERVLWQGAPDWRAVAARVFHIRAVAAYFTLLTLIDIGIIRQAEGPGLLALKAGGPTAITGLVCVGILAFLAFAIGRTTRYTLTTRRIIMQFGVALPATLMLPLHKVARCEVAVRKDGSGDIALLLFPGSEIAYFKLWPHARPWRLRKPLPMLRDIPGAAILANQLTRALTACADARRAAEHDRAAFAAPGISVPAPGFNDPVREIGAAAPGISPPPAATSPVAATSPAATPFGAQPFAAAAE